MFYMINEKIRALYERWRGEVQCKYPYLFEQNFSNIFCPGITDDWAKSNIRMLIIGEEATWGSRSLYPKYEDNELLECQRWIIDDLSTKLSSDTKRCSSNFWKRIYAFQNAFPNAAFCWSNIDCINNAVTKGALKEKDRKALHDCDTQLIRELVELIQPTHMVFFGWHNTSLKHEFPDLCDVVYPDAFDDKQYLKKNGYIVDTVWKGIKVVFTYHPQWLKASSNKYIERLIDVLR